MTDPTALPTPASGAPYDERIPAYATRLNEPQRDAVLTTDGPVLMLAGAGTGKTAALTARLAHLVAMRLAWPSEILCVTFTNRAAREMRERVGQHLGQAVDGMPWLGTFHSVCAKMLRRHAELAGLESNYTIIDTDDQIRLLKQLITENDLDEKRWPARQLAALIDRWKNRGLNPADLDAVENESYANGHGAKFYGLYQDRLKALNACDFGDLMLHMLNIFRKHREVLEQYQNRFKYVMVDEYQDTNAVQYLWLRLLAQTRKNICVVGDDDQSIYSWRGAEVANILRFEKDFPGCKVIKLEQNYRSTPHILGAASGLIKANSERLGKTLWTEINGGDKVTVTGVWDAPEEARRVGEAIERLEGEGANLDEVAILVRAQYQTREFEDRFIQIGINYRIIGGFRSPLSVSTINPSAGLARKRWRKCTSTRGARASLWPRHRCNWPIVMSCPSARRTQSAISCANSSHGVNNPKSSRQRNCCALSWPRAAMTRCFRKIARRTARAVRKTCQSWPARWKNMKRWAIFSSMWRW